MRTLLLPILLLVGCTTPRPSFHNALLDTIPEGMAARDFRFGRDGTVAAYIRFDNRGNDRVVLNPLVGKPLKLI